MAACFTSATRKLIRSGDRERDRPSILVRSTVVVPAPGAPTTATRSSTLSDPRTAEEFVKARGPGEVQGDWGPRGIHADRNRQQSRGFLFPPHCLRVELPTVESVEPKNVGVVLICSSPAVPASGQVPSAARRRRGSAAPPPPRREAQRRVDGQGGSAPSVRSVRWANLTPGSPGRCGPTAPGIRGADLMG